MVFDRYLFRNLALATAFIALTLAAVVLLTQSLRFLELVISAGAPASAFWLLTALALPRFFEIILPIALMTAIVFTYNRLAMDSELTVMRGAGASPAALARPALVLAALTALLLWVITMWLAPVSLSGMHGLRQAIKTQYSTLLFREGVFTAVRPGITVFVRERKSSGELRGLVIHDSRNGDKPPVTILAKSGAAAMTETGQQIIVYEGSRQDVNPETGVLNRLDFKRYALDLPEAGGEKNRRWREPDERTVFELLRPGQADRRDSENERELAIEIHRRIVSPLLAPAFAAAALAFLLSGGIDRRGQGKRIAAAIATAIGTQSLYLAAFSAARHSGWGIAAMYALALAPLLAGAAVLFDGGNGAAARLLRTRPAAGKAAA